MIKVVGDFERLDSASTARRSSIAVTSPRIFKSARKRTNQETNLLSLKPNAETHPFHHGVLPETEVPQDVEDETAVLFPKITVGFKDSIASASEDLVGQFKGEAI